MRLGSFSISGELMRKSPALAQSLMANMLIYRAEHIYERDEFEYVAESPLFEKLREGQVTPKYTMTWSRKTGWIAQLPIMERLV